MSGRAVADPAAHANPRGAAVEAQPGASAKGDRRRKPPPAPRAAPADKGAAKEKEYKNPMQPLSTPGSSGSSRAPSDAMAASARASKERTSSGGRVGSRDSHPGRPTRPTGRYEPSELV